MSEIIYLYGFAPTAATPPGSLGGVHGAGVTVAAAGDVHVIYSRVPMADFSPTVIDANIQDLNWVGARGLEHERVVAWFVDNAEILPVSLFALYSSETALIEDAVSRSSAVAAQLARLHGQREWDLKVSYDHQRLSDHAADVMESVRDIDAEMATAAAGKRFLLERKRSEILKKDLAGAAQKTARALLERCAAYAADAVALPIPRAEGLPVVLNAALLVARDSEQVFRNDVAAETETLREMGINVQLTGPWAPYRFTESRDDAAS